VLSKALKGKKLTEYACEAKLNMAPILVTPSPRALLHVKFHLIFIYYLMILGGHPCWVRILIF
jgi:hypothetical protein